MSDSQQVSCPRCGQTRKASDPVCPKCGHAQWKSILANGVFSVLCLLVAVLVSPHIGSPLWQALVRWGVGIFGAGCLLGTLTNAARALRVPARVIDLAWTLFSVALLLLVGWGLVQLARSGLGAVGKAMPQSTQVTQPPILAAGWEGTTVRSLCLAVCRRVAVFQQAR